jgi:carbon starvation protein CstA
LHISMAKAVMWMCHNLNIICTLPVWFLFSPHNFLFHFLWAFAVMKSVYQFGHVCVSASIDSAPSGWMFMKFDIGGFY